MFCAKYTNLFKDANALLGEKRIDDAANLILPYIVNNPPTVKPGEGISVFAKVIDRLLNAGRYHDVATIIWPETLFTLEPESVFEIWTDLPQESEYIVQGAGSMSKSYSIAAWLLLDWIRDPEWTAIHVVSVTREHAKKNVFSHIQNLHKQSYLPLAGESTSTSLMVGTNMQQGIHLVAIPIGQDGSGRLQGLHPARRPVPHPIFGVLSRLRAILDEAEEIAQGVWKDVDNFLIGKFDAEHLKVAAAANPRDQSSEFGQRCEPVAGWNSIDIESSYAWRSKLGWGIRRLDAARCANVIQRKMVHEGFATWDGYQRYLARGIDDPEYYTMARGWFPQAGTSMSIIHRDLVERSVGDARFIGLVTYAMSLDTSLEGGDRPLVTVGRYGLADGWYAKGKEEIIKFPKARFVAQIESQFELERGDTVKIAQQFMDHSKSLKIAPDWLAVDRTGNGAGVHDLLRTWLGNDVLGVDFSEGSTHTKILEEDLEFADDQYSGLVTELFFAVRLWAEFGYLKFSQHLQTKELFDQFVSRRYKPGRLARVESKREYKGRGFKSPDHADSATIWLHLIRTRAEFAAQMVPEPQPEQLIGSAQSAGPADNLQFIDFQS